MGVAKVVMADLLNGVLNDLCYETCLDRIMEGVDAGRFDALVASPPCSSFSRARRASRRLRRPFVIKNPAVRPGEVSIFSIRNSRTSWRSRAST